MRKRKLWQRVILSGSATIAMLATLSASSVSAAGEHDGRLTDRADHTDKNFEDYEYGRVDVADFDAIIDGLEDLVQDPANADQVLDVIVGMEDFYCEAARNYSIAHIKSDLVADDQYWDDEVMFWDELTTDIGDKIMTSYNVIATSLNADVLHERVDDEDDWQDILDYTVMTQEQKDLSAKETELSLQYDILYNKEYTTKINGKDYTEEELSDLVADGTINRDEYQAAYCDLLTQCNQERGELFLELVDVRTQLAKSYGYDNFAEYAYDKRYGRDYTTEELKDYRDQVKQYVVPLQDELLLELYGSHYSELMDMFEEEKSEQDCLDTLRKYLPEISSDLLVSLDYMEDHHLYDLSISDEKAPGGYTISIGGYNAPFIYNCADGTIQDMETLIHEFGHYNQMYYMTADSWYYDESNLDLAEIHSQGLEMLFMDYADDIYGDYADVMKLYTLFNLAYATVEGCKEDAFQYEVYTNPDGLTVEKLNEIYYNCCMEYSDRFGAMLNESISYGQSGQLPANQCYEWAQIPHTFQSPMYYISYSVSAAAVFELFDVILDDRDEGIDCYLALVDSEYQDSFQNTLNTVGLNNPIANPRFELYADDIRYELGLVDERTVVNNYDPHIATTYWGGGGEAISHGNDNSDPDAEPTEAAEPTPEEDEDDVVADPGVDEQKEQATREALNRMAIAGVIAVVMFLAAILVIVVVIVKLKKEKKAEQGIALNRPVNAPNPYLEQNRAAQSNPMGGNSPYVQQNPYMQQGGNIAPQGQAPINPYAGQAGTANAASTAGNISQPANPYMQQDAPIGGQITPNNTMINTTASDSISSANILEKSESSINPYTSQTTINPYAQQPLQINPYANQTPNPYLQNLQQMQTQQQQSVAQVGQMAAQSTEQAQNAAQETMAAVTAEQAMYLQQLTARIPADQKEGLVAMIRQGDKITAIGECRKLTGAGLAEAKELVEQFEKFLV
ncbi:MAG: hypothetical protein IKO10_08920 [Lachnospiraceae bacterium]|nr:hypothetical protein [Lachnospiraceae bacterium]